MKPQNYRFREMNNIKQETTSFCVESLNVCRMIHEYHRVLNYKNILINFDIFNGRYAVLETLC